LERPLRAFGSTNLMTAYESRPGGHDLADRTARGPDTERLLEVASYGILDTPAEDEFDDLAFLAARICETPIAAISFIETDRQWFKARIGLEISEMSCRQGFCHYTLQQRDVYQVIDALAGSRFADNPMVHGRLRARFYAGVPLVTRTGCAIGTLFVLDHRSRDLTPEQRRSLLALSRSAVALLDARRAAKLQGRHQIELHQVRTAADQRVESRAADLKEANEQLETFAYSVSHDLCSPLRAIDAYAQMLGREFGTTMGREANRQLELISQNVRQMRQLITGLLQFSRFSRQPLHRQRIQLKRFVTGIVGEMSEEREDRLQVVEIGDLPDCHADPLLLKQLFANLLSNALKFTRSCNPARIAVGWESRDGEAIFHVRDNGVGFDMHYADRLFGVFQRLHRSEEFEGTGVGLSIVKRIVHRHGGRVWAEGRVNQGATFYFTLSS